MTSEEQLLQILKLLIQAVVDCEATNYSETARCSLAKTRADATNICFLHEVKNNKSTGSLGTLPKDFFK